MQSGEDFQDVDGNHYKAIRRAIGKGDCSHFAIPVFSNATRVYSDERLEEMRRSNHEGAVIDGKHYTKYECTQIMRRLEAESRRQKEIAIAAAGNMEIRRQCQIEINAISAKYTAVADAAGLRERRQRMMVAGFRAVNIKLDNERKANAPDYQWIKENLPAMCPKSLDGYRRMKKQNTKNYRKIVEAARAMGYEIT